MSEIECQICFDTTADAMALCREGHMFCSECCWRCCASAFGDGLQPACPLEKEHKCGVITKATALTALTRWLSAPGQTQRRKTELGAWSIKGSAAAGYSSGKIDAIYLASKRAAQGAVQCIGKIKGKACDAWYVPRNPHSQQPQRVVCTLSKCCTSFCAACRHPYHFRTTCAEALRAQARWIRFLQSELGPFLMAAVRVDPGRYEEQLKAHTKSKGALDEATRDALSRFDELKKMEEWKEKHCRHCPHCARVVEKMSGCDSMMCGSDAHSGTNQQNGCGKPFTWSQARPYQADLRSAAADGGGGGDGVSVSIERRLQLDAKEEHLLCPGEPVLCDGCASPIVGPRLQCLHCDGAVDLCIGCVAKAAHGKAFELRDGRRHPPQHVFRRVRQAPLDGDGGGGGGASATPTIAIDQPPISINLLPPSSSEGPTTVDLVGGGDAAAERRRRKRPINGGHAHGGGSSLHDSLVLESDEEEESAAQGGAFAAASSGHAAASAIELDDDDDDDDVLQQALRASLLESAGAKGGTSSQQARSNKARAIDVD